MYAHGKYGRNSTAARGVGGRRGGVGEGAESRMSVAVGARFIIANVEAINRV